MPSVLSLWKLSARLPRGERLFSYAFARKAPYFRTVRPRFTVLEPHRAELVLPKRRAVHNHLGTVHAIAVCNGLEAAMGALAEATIPADKRWIPKGMTVAYTAKATSTSPASPRPTRSSGRRRPARRRRRRRGPGAGAPATTARSWSRARSGCGSPQRPAVT